MCSCPFAYLHLDGDDKTPSFAIHKETGVWHCFTCGEKGTLVSLIKKLKNVSDSVAQQIIQGYEDVSFQRIKKKLSNLREQHSERKAEVKVITLPGLVEVETCKKALQYLQNRGLYLNVIRKFNIQFCQRGLYKDRLIIPIFYERKCVGFIARDITDQAESKYLLPSEFKKSKYLFNIDTINSNKPVWLVEGVFDVLKLFQFGLRNVVAVFGSEVSDTQVALLLRKNVREVVLCFDSDQAGTKVMKNFIRKYNQFFKVCVTQLPDLKDPGDLSTIDEFKKLLSSVKEIGVNTDIENDVSVKLKRINIRLKNLGFEVLSSKNNNRDLLVTQGF